LRRGDSGRRLVSRRGGRRRLRHDGRRLPPHDELAVDAVDATGAVHFGDEGRERRILTGCLHDGLRLLESAPADAGGASEAVLGAGLQRGQLARCVRPAPRGGAAVTLLPRTGLFPLRRLERRGDGDHLRRQEVLPDDVLGELAAGDVAERHDVHRDLPAPEEAERLEPAPPGDEPVPLVNHDRVKEPYLVDAPREAGDVARVTAEAPTDLDGADRKDGCGGPHAALRVGMSDRGSDGASSLAGPVALAAAVGARRGRLRAARARGCLRCACGTRTFPSGRSARKA